MDRFLLRMWRGNSITYQKSDLLTAANSILARAHELAVRAAELEAQFHPFTEFATLFSKQITRELPSLSKINHTINIIPESSWIPTY